MKWSVLKVEWSTQYLRGLSRRHNSSFCVRKFNRLGIRNFLEGGFFGWYITAWDEELVESVREMTRLLSEFEPATSSLEPEATRDLLKKLYQYLVPRELRQVKEEIDREAAELWELTKEELREIQDSLREIR